MTFEEVLYDAFLEYDSKSEPTSRDDEDARFWVRRYNNHKNETIHFYFYNKTVEVNNEPRNLNVKDVFKTDYYLYNVSKWHDGLNDGEPKYRKHGERFYDAVYGLRQGELWAFDGSYIIYKEGILKVIDKDGRVTSLTFIPNEMIFEDKWARVSIDGDNSL